MSQLTHKLLSTKEASARSGYHTDYLARLAKNGKITATRVGRSWLIDEESLSNFIESQQERRRELSEILSRERVGEYQALIEESKIPETTLAEKSSSGGFRSPVSLGSFPSHAFAILVALAVTGTGLYFAQAEFIDGQVTRSVQGIVAQGYEFNSGAARWYDSMENAIAVRSHTTVALENTAIPTLHLEPIILPAIVSPVYGSDVPVTEKILATNASPVISHESFTASLASSSATLAELISDPKEFGTLYLESINTAGSSLTSLALLVRDGGYALPAQLELHGTTVAIFAQDVSHQILSAYQTGIYAWAVTTPDVPETTTIALLQIGTTLHSTTLDAPARLAATYNQAIGNFVMGSFAIRDVATEQERGALIGSQNALASTSVFLADVIAQGPQVVANTRPIAGTFEAVLPQQGDSTMDVPEKTAAFFGSFGGIFSTISTGANDLLALIGSDRFFPTLHQDGREVAVFTYHTINDFFDCFGQSVTYLAELFRPQNIAIIPAALFPNEPQDVATTTITTTATSTTKTIIGPASTLVQNVANYFTIGGITNAYLEQRLAEVSRQIVIQILDRRGGQGGGGPVDLTHIDGSTITNSTFSGPSVSTTNLSATNATTTNFYAYDAHIDNLTVATGTILTNNLVVTNSTTTNATSTNLFSTNASVTNFFANLATIGDILATNATTTNLVATNATSTNFFSTNGTIDNFFSTLATITGLTTTNATTTNLTISSLTAGRVPFVGIGGFLQDSANLLFDGTTLTANTLHLTNPLEVAYGGTGTTTLSGILKGNGTGPVTSAIGDTDYQLPIGLTTTGSGGPATFIGDILNIPIYSSVSTSTSNTWGGTQTFTNAPILDSLTGLIAGDNGVLSAVATTTATCAGTTSCTTFTIIGTTPVTITGGGSGAAVTGIGPAGQIQNGPIVTLATSTTAFNGLTSALTITASSNTITFAPSLSGTLDNAGLTNSTVSYGGVTLSLGQSDATPAFDLTDAFNLPINAGTTGTLGIARGGTNAVSQVTNGVNYFDGTSITSGSNFTFDGTQLTTPDFLATNATSTNLFATNGTITNLFTDLVNVANLIVGNSTTTNATTTNLFATNGTINTFFSTIATITGLTTTNATTTNLLATNATTTGLTISSLTAGRVPFVGIGGFLQDSVNLLFDGTTLTANTLNLANALGAIYGGTGQNAVTTGDLLFGSATNTWSRLADVATGNVLLSGGIGVAPSWGKVGLTTAVSGVLPIANGGTATSTQTTNGVNFFDGTSITSNSGFVYTGGNVGIGTTAPLAKLHVTGFARVGGEPTARGDVIIDQTTNVATTVGGLEFKADSAGSGYGSRILDVFDGAAAYNLQFQNRTNSASWTNIMTLGSTGNVGIGTTTPAAKLDVYGGNTVAGLANVGLSIANGGDRLLFGAPSGGNPYIGVENTSSLRFFNGTTQTMTLTSAGNLGIGSSTPSAKLVVVGQTIGQYFTATSTTQASTFPYASTTALTNSTALYNSYLGVNRVPYTTTGGLLTDSANMIYDGSAFYVAGSIHNNNIDLTNAPEGDLEIKGISPGVSSPHIDLADSGATDFDWRLEQNSTANIFSIYSSANTNILTLAKTSGNVGIGSSTPNAKLSVKGNGTSTGMTFQLTDSTNLPILTALDNGRVGIGTTTPSVRFEIGDSENAVIDSIVTNSNVGTTAFASMQVRNGYTTSADGMRMLAMGTGWTTSGAFVQDSGVLDAGSNLAGGLSIVSRNASAPIRLYTGGSAAGNERVRIDNVGNVGIGNTAPAYKLVVDAGTGGSVFQSVSALNALAYSDFQNSSNTDGSTGVIQRLITYNAAGSGLTTVDLVKYKTGGFYITNNEPSASGFTSFGVGGSERVRISAAGYVGIANSNPLSKLSVNGAGQLTAALTDAGIRDANIAIDSTSALGGAGGAITFGNAQSIAAGSIGYAAIKGLLTNGSGNTTGDLAFSTRNAVADTALTERMRILANGNVGIGIAAPFAKLDVRGAGTGTAVASSGTTDATTNLRVSRGTVGLDIGTLDGGDSYLQNRNISNFATNYNLVLEPNGGNVGIGMTPTYKLDVTGNIRASTEIIVSNYSTGQLRAIGGNYGTILRNDGTNTYLLATASGDQYGSWSSIRPFAFDNNTGVLTSSNGQVFGGGTTVSGILNAIGPSIVLNNSAADGANLTFNSLGFSAWNMDNFSGTLRFFNSGTPSFQIDSSGNVAALTGDLTVSTLGKGLVLAGGGGFNMTDTTWIRVTGGKSIYQPSGIMRTDGSLQVGGNGATFIATSGGNVGVGDITPASLFTVGNGDLFQVDSSGNITFANANPNITSGGSWIGIPNGAYFSGGTVYVTNAIQARGGIANDTAAYLTLSGGTSGYTFVNGRLGVGPGMSAPAYQLDVHGDTASFWAINNPTSVATAKQITIGENTNNASYRLSLGYFNDGTWRSSIQSTAGGSGATLILNGVGGAVGINNTAPTFGLDTIGTGRFKTSSDVSSAFVVQNSGGTSVFQVDTANNASDIFSVATSTGAVYFDISATGKTFLSSSLGTGTGGNFLCINTSTYEVTRGNGSACTPSSLKFKDHVEDLTYGLSDIMKLRPVSYTYKEGTNMGPGVKLGLIAEEVDSIIPEAVTHDDTGAIYGLDYQLMTPVLIKAVQQLDLSIEDLATSTAIADLQAGSFAQRFWTSLTGRLITWFADTTNGIGDVFVKKVHTGELCVSDANGASTCITKSQLDALLANAGTAGSGGGNNNGGNQNGGSGNNGGGTMPPPDNNQNGQGSAPTITLNGAAALEIEQGDSFSDAGATASDAEDGDLTSAITVSGSVDTGTEGSYTLTYSVLDSNGNYAEVSRMVVVQAPDSSGGGGVIETPTPPAETQTPPPADDTNTPPADSGNDDSGQATVSTDAPSGE